RPVDDAVPHGVQRAGSRHRGCCTPAAVVDPRGGRAAPHDHRRRRTLPSGGQRRGAGARGVRLHRRHTVTLAPSDGLNIHYQDTASGPPLVLLAGFTASGLLWPQAFVAALQEQQRLLRICNRGTGHSDVPDQPFTVTDMANDVVAVLDHANLASANVLGWSMGGIIAQQLALSAPDRVDKLVLANSWPPGGEVRADAIRLDGDSVWGALSGEGQRHAEELHELDAAFVAQPPSIEG